jgi:putative ABC transport system permease protein
MADRRPDEMNRASLQTDAGVQRYAISVLLDAKIILEGIMLKNYLKIAIKNILRNKLYSFVAAFGLAVGFGVCILALQYLVFEFSFDNIPVKNRVYQVIVDLKFGGVVQKMAGTPPHLDKEMKSYFPEIESAASFVIMPESVRQKNRIEKSFHFCTADFHIFGLLGLQLIQGNEQTCLLDPNSIVVSEKFAKDYFKAENPLDKTIEIHNFSGWHDFKVAGIIKDVPENSSFSFDAILSNESSPNLNKNYQFTWNASMPLCFVKLNSEVDVKKFTGKLKKFIKDTGGNTIFYSLELLPMHNVHFRTDINTPLLTCETKYLYILSLVALLIFAVSIFNFVGINITLLSKRMKEIGIRKIVGASRIGIMIQFLIENAILLIVSLSAGVCIYEILLPLFNTMLDVNLKVSDLSGISAIAILFILIIILDFSVGIYTTHFFLTQNIHSLMKKQIWNLNPRHNLRKVLIGFQFSIAAFLICCTMVVIDQLNFIKHKDIGFEKKNILIIDQSSIRDRNDVLREELRSNPYIIDVSESGIFPSLGLNSSITGTYDNGKKTVKLNEIDVDEHFLPMLKIHLIKGRNFNPEFTSDSTGSVILNEEAFKELTAAETMSADSVHFYGNNWKVIGIVKNFNYTSLRNNVEPIVLDFQKTTYPYLGIKIQDGKTKEVLNYLNGVWKKVNPGHKLQYNFLDEDVNKLYSNEDRVFTSILSGSIIAILIALLGIFALSSFISETKTKEIAIRKVVGSSIANIVKLLSSGFLKIVLASNLIAWPAAYLIMKNWLENFAYRVNVHVFIFPLSALIMIILVLATISFQSIKAATANPVKSLKYE